MQYAIVDGQRREAFTEGKGTCPTCNAGMVAKCGPRVLHHWAHAKRRNCDPWWENETPWHRAWKSLFPEDCREISHLAPDGEIHRADIRTPTGIYIEVQHSSMTDAERHSREVFYGNLVWVLDGSSFRKNFDIYHGLPDPTSELARDLVWFKATRKRPGCMPGAFFRLSENPGEIKTTRSGGMVRVHGIHKIQSEVDATYYGHHQYDWIRPHSSWLNASCPIYIDFGGKVLAKLEIYDESGLPCIRWVAKQKFVHDAMTEFKAEAIATSFYRISESQT